MEKEKEKEVKRGCELFVFGNCNLRGAGDEEEPGASVLLWEVGGGQRGLLRLGRHCSRSGRPLFPPSLGKICFMHRLQGVSASCFCWDGGNLWMIGQGNFWAKGLVWEAMGGLLYYQRWEGTSFGMPQ